MSDRIRRVQVQRNRHPSPLGCRWMVLWKTPVFGHDACAFFPTWGRAMAHAEAVSCDLNSPSMTVDGACLKGTDQSPPPVCCPWCLSTDPNKVGVEKATGKTCRDPFHCPTPDAHGNPFLICPYCDWREDPLIEPPAEWAVGWADEA